MQICLPYLGGCKGRKVPSSESEEGGTLTCLLAPTLSTQLDKPAEVFYQYALERDMARCPPIDEVRGMLVTACKC
jgi:hypothetical protein